MISLRMCLIAALATVSSAFAPTPYVSDMITAQRALTSPSAVMLFKQKAAPKKAVAQKGKPAKKAKGKPAKKVAKKPVAQKKAAPKKAPPAKKEFAPLAKPKPYDPPEWNQLKQAFALPLVGGAKGNVMSPGGRPGQGYDVIKNPFDISVDTFGQ